MALPLVSPVPAASHLENELAELFSENVVAKVYRTASQLTNTTDRFLPPYDSIQAVNIPTGYPEYVPQNGGHVGRWVVRKPTLWTCGFFPGTVYALLERLIRHPDALHRQFTDPHVFKNLQSDLATLAKLCTEPLHSMVDRTDTHDIGFMVMPAIRRQWELTGVERSLQSLRRAAHSLSSRFVYSAKAIRSWDTRIQNNVQITSTTDHLILIIDSVCNLDLLYYAASKFPEDSSLADIATMHAITLLRTHLRPETPENPPQEAYTGQWYSTHHVADLNPTDGSVRQHFTAQGYSDTSTWARGQSWGILGFAQTYMWTKDTKFLDAACGIAENFLRRMEDGPAYTEMTSDGKYVRKARYVPLWDFDAPVEDSANPILDSSAAAVSANGMLIISQALAALGQPQLSTRFRVAALQIATDLTHVALSKEKARLVSSGDAGITVEDVHHEQRFDGLLKHGTANNNKDATERYWNHALVYGDYYWVELGNRLLGMGLL